MLFTWSFFVDNIGDTTVIGGCYLTVGFDYSPGWRREKEAEVDCEDVRIAAADYMYFSVFIYEGLASV